MKSTGRRLAGNGAGMEWDLGALGMTISSTLIVLVDHVTCRCSLLPIADGHSTNEP